MNDRPEDNMNHPPVEYLDEAIVPAKYRKMAEDSTACRAVAAMVLDFALDELTDGKEYAGLAAIARCWLKLSELADKARE